MFTFSSISSVLTPDGRLLIYGTRLLFSSTATAASKDDAYINCNECAVTARKFSDRYAARP